VAVKAVAFDLGETLVDETRFWGEWAEWAGIRPLELHAALGATVVERRHHHDAFRLVRDDFDAEAAIEERRAAGWPDAFVEADLFEDAERCLARLRAAGYRTCVAGNQPSWMIERLRGWSWSVDVVTGAEDLDAEKPQAEFFARLARLLGADPADVAYVGDRVDNDVVPASDAGMHAVFLRRGPWGVLQAEWPEAERAHVRIDSLDELPEALERV
jgi:HAD superfamily hydrolase (TIGR01549 family)